MVWMQKYFERFIITGRSTNTPQTHVQHNTPTNRLSIFITEPAVNASSPVVGSSKNNTAGSFTSSIPMQVRFRSPPETPRTSSLPSYGVGQGKDRNGDQNYDDDSEEEDDDGDDWAMVMIMKKMRRRIMAWLHLDKIMPAITYQTWSKPYDSRLKPLHSWYQMLHSRTILEKLQCNVAIQECKIVNYGKMSREKSNSKWRRRMYF